MGKQTNMQVKWTELLESIVTCSQMLKCLEPPDNWDALTKIKKIDDDMWSILETVEEVKPEK